MTQPQGATTPSTFNARADQGAQALRAQLNAQGRQMPASAPVAVDSNGHPPAPLPPEGSYARQAMELQRRQQAQIGDQPPAGTPRQAMDGSVAPPMPAEPAPQVPTEEPVSPNAERRIRELIDKLRAKEQELELSRDESRKQGETLQQMQARLQSTIEQHQQMLQANLENLDPLERAQVMQDARMSQRLDDFEKRIVDRLQPQLQDLQTKAARSEMEKLADRYPAFDYQIHGNLIDMYRAKNPYSTIDQAFRAVAKDDELMTRSSARAAAVPPVVPPGNGSVQSTRYAPAPEPAPNSDAELSAQARKIKELRSSTDPAKQKEGLAQIHDNLARRLGLR